MLAAKIPKTNTIKVVEEEIPVPKKGEVLIKMKASALCRSDLHRYHGVAIFDEEDEKSANITPGHEPCGIVEELPAWRRDALQGFCMYRICSEWSPCGLYGNTGR